MNKDKKILKLRDDLQRLEKELKDSLTKKESGKAEINLSKIHSKISEKLLEIKKLNE